MAAIIDEFFCAICGDIVDTEKDRGHLFMLVYAGQIVVVLHRRCMAPTRKK